MAIPAFTPAEAANRDTFLALMWAFSYPGRAQRLPGAAPDAFAAIAAALLDLETRYYTPDAALDPILRHTTARAAPIHEAGYLFYPTLSAADLDPIGQANPGTMLFPDTAATLILGCTLGGGTALRLSGPGIRGTATVQVGGLPTAFWALRERTRRFPLGWDIVLVDSGQVVGLPRSTAIDVG